MQKYNSEISGWLKVSGNNLLDVLPSGFPLWRIVTKNSEQYWTGFVSTGGGSFKPAGTSGNFYGDALDVAVAEKQRTGAEIYEYSRLQQDTPVWNMNKLPQQFLSAIHEDGNLTTGQYRKSQFAVECLEALGLYSNASGIYFPSRRAPGGVVVLNPQAVSIEILYTGQAPLI